VLVRGELPGVRDRACPGRDAHGEERRPRALHQFAEMVVDAVEHDRRRPDRQDVLVDVPAYPGPQGHEDVLSREGHYSNLTFAWQAAEARRTMVSRGCGLDVGERKTMAAASRSTTSKLVTADCSPCATLTSTPAPGNVTGMILLLVTMSPKRAKASEIALMIRSRMGLPPVMPSVAFDWKLALTSHPEVPAVHASRCRPSSAARSSCGRP